MANRIKGITVEIGGDTTKLDKALAGTNKELKTTQDNLRDVDRLLKIDPKNTVLLEQKQKLLAEAIEGTKKKLDTLKDAAAQAGEALKKGTIDSNQYDALQREIIQTEKNLESLEKQQKSTNESMNKFASAVDTAAQKTRGVADKIGGISTAVKTLGIAAVATIPATEDFRDGMSKLKTTADEMNISMENSKEAFRNFYQVVGDTDSAFEATNNLVNLKLEGEGLANAVDLISGAVIRFPDTLNIESLADSLQETVATGEATGQFAELLGRLGINTEQFAESLSMYSDESDRLDIALSALASKGLLDVTEAWKDANPEILNSRNATLDMKDALSQLADKLTPLITDVTNLATAFLDWFNGINTEGQIAAGIIGGLIIAIKPISGIITGISDAIPILSDVLGRAKTWFSDAGISAGGFGLVLVGLIIAIGEISKAWDGMTGWQKVVSIFGTVAAAALGAALAFGVFHSATSKGLAIAGIVAGILAVTAAVASAKKNVESMSRSTSGFGNGSGGFGGSSQSSSSSTSSLADLSALFNQKTSATSATGTAYGYETETYTKGPTTYTSERYVGDQAAPNVNINFTGNLSQLARALKPEIEIESARSGSTARR